MEPNTPKVEQESWLELIKFVGLVLLIVIPIRTWVAQPFIVSGASMDPTFTDHDYLIVDELSYQFRQPHRGEVIIFRYPADPSRFFIKRVIGLPNETVTIKNNSIAITTASSSPITLSEPYITDVTSPDMVKKLGPKEYFVMGDNREESFDSRSWGAVPETLIRGRALLRLWPLNEIGLLPGAANQ